MASPKGSILLTGASGGLGSHIVAHIAKTPDLASNYVGLYTVRKAATASQLQSALGRAPASHKHETLELDLTSLDNVRKFAADINDRVAKGALPRIRALILNAGYHAGTELVMSEDGFELTWQINYLVNFLLSLLLLESMDKQHGRILIIASWSHDTEDKRNRMGGNRTFDDPKWQSLFPEPEALAKGQWSTQEDDADADSGFLRYGASKLCAVMLMEELGLRLGRDPALSGVSVMGLDPGGMGTGIGRRSGFMRGFVTFKILVPLVAWYSTSSDPNGPLRPLWKSAGDVIRACFEIEPPEGKGLYLDGTEEVVNSKEARDEVKRKSLWEYSVKAAGMDEEATALKDWQ